MSAANVTTPASPEFSPRRIAGVLRAARGLLNIKGCLFVVVVILIWQVLVSTKVLDFDFLPAPSAIWTAAVGLTRDGELFPPLQHTLIAAVIGWAIASAAGLVIGLAMGASPMVWRYSMSSIDVIRSIPAITFLPVVALVFGISLKAEFVFIVYVAAWPVLLNALSGVQNVRAGHRDVARVLQLSRPALIRKVVLPSAAPNILVGLRLSMGLSLTMAVVSELLVNPEGMGYSLYEQQQLFHAPEMFAFVILIGVLGFLLNAVLILVANLTLPPSVRGSAVKREGGAY